MSHPAAGALKAPGAYAAAVSGGELFGALFVPDAMRDAVGDRAWIGAMLRFEAALAAAEAAADLLPGDAAEAIAAACEPDRFDAAALGRAGRDAGNPAAPLVAELTAAVGGEAARHVHRGATSQDVMDTAAMLVTRDALAVLDGSLRAVAEACARLADEHRGTLMAGRTLLQQALPVTFGLKAAGWLDAVLDARDRLAGVPLAVQLGGAAGTLAALGGDGPRVVALLAEGLGLEEPALPWHTARARVAEIGAALAIAAGVLDKIALDVVLLAQTEVAEVAEAGGAGRGGSSTLPHKRNPVAAARARACARRVRADVSVLLDAMPQEHERAAGAWQAEWEALSGALAYAGGAADAVRESLAALEVHPGAMRANLERTGGLVMAEAVSTALAAKAGRAEAHDAVAAAARRAGDSGRSLRDELRDDPRVELSAEELDRALDPAGYLGAADELIDRALARFREEP